MFGLGRYVPTEENGRRTEENGRGLKKTEEGRGDGFSDPQSSSVPLLSSSVGMGADGL